jgi:dienelactone hydrolase
VLLAAATGGFYLWATSTPGPGPDAVAALDSDEQVQVIEDNGYTFQPTQPARVGFIFYPGGRVDPASYAAPAREIAEAGYLVVVPELTLNLAVLDADAADDIIADHPEIERWVIGGHSLGGTIAATYAGEHRESISGLVLWAAYPSNSTDLSTLDADVASIFGTRDGLTTLDDIDDSRNRLPPDTDFVSIEGGNHAQFGDYGSQARDHPATISREEQQAQAVQASLRILNAVK